MLLDLTKVIGNPGRELPFEAEYDFRDMQFGSCYPVTEPVRAVGSVKNVADVLMLEGEITTRIHGVCDRCAKAFTRELSVPVHGILETNSDSSVPDDLWTFTVEEDRLDPEEIIRTAFVLNMDSKLLCKEDCKGLCFRCGADLNLGTCDCKPERDSRFAVLQQLLERP